MQYNKKRNSKLLKNNKQIILLFSNNFNLNFNLQIKKPKHPIELNHIIKKVN